MHDEVDEETRSQPHVTEVQPPAGPIAVASTTMAGSNAPPAAGHAADAYAMHPFWLYFTDPDMEAAFTQYHFIDSGCYGGKAYCVLAGLVSFFLIWVTFQRDYHPTADTVAPWYNIPCIIAASFDFVLFGSLFIPAFIRWREWIILLCVFLHWPTFIIADMQGPDAYQYVYAAGCFFFCCLVALPRFFTMTAVLVVSPVAGYFGVTFGVKEHFEQHSHTEIVLWPAFVFALATLRIFEGRARDAFAHRHQARDRLERIDRQIELTQEMVVRYFPATPTAALVNKQSTNREYPLTAMIMTDIRGFTAYANRAKPEAVIDAVRVMFERYDAAAQRWGAEKVSTVGDAYFAAIFASLADMHPQLTAANRATRAVAFAFAAVDSAVVELPVRVGVHVGTAVGGFVGASPPKFDLFGEAVDQCKYMEQGGEAGLTHVSHATAALVRSVAAEMGRVTSKTALGELWMSQPVSLNFAGHHVDLDGNPTDVDDIASVSSDDGPTRAEACRALLGLVREDTSVTGMRVTDVERDNDDEDDVSRDSASDNSNGDGDGARKEDEEARFALNYLLLEFKNASTEAKYRAHYAKRSITPRLAKLIVAMLCYFLLGCLFMMCVDVMANKIVVMVVAFAPVAITTYMTLTPPEHMRPVVVSLLLHSAFVVLYLAGSTTCQIENRSVAAYNLRNLAGLMWDFCIVADSLVLDRPFKLRMAIIIFQSLELNGLIAIRQAIYTDDSVSAWSWIPLAAFACHALSSFGVEVMEREAFAAATLLRLTMRSAKGREAEQAEQALDVMLPRFATEKLLRGGNATRHRSDSMNASVEIDDPLDERRTLISSADSNSNSLNHRSLHTLRLSWSIEFAAVMFIDLGAATDLLVVDRTIRRIEAVLNQHPNAVKVKSNGNAVLCAVGIDDTTDVIHQGSDTTSRDDELLTTAVGVRGHIVLAAATAALAIEHAVLRELDGPSEAWRIGIHAGPLIGAVFGSQGVIFDVFGDTVNSASRVAFTGGVRQVTASQAVARLLQAARQAGVREVPEECGRREVTMKGLGTVETVQLRRVASPAV